MLKLRTLIRLLLLSAWEAPQGVTRTLCVDEVGRIAVTFRYGPAKRQVVIAPGVPLRAGVWAMLRGLAEDCRDEGRMIDADFQARLEWLAELRIAHRLDTAAFVFERGLARAVAPREDAPC